MTELKLKISEDFFMPEKRNSFLITREMKELWAVELDLLHEIDRVCEKYHLQYYADGGTLLGAVRHKGYIPWDDDIDIMMKRDQYELLCEIGQDEFKYPYFLQTEYTDPSSLRGHAQLRNSATTGILKDDAKGIRIFNQGIFIDIFPLDAVPDEDELLERKIKKVGYYLTRARMLAHLTDAYTPSPDNKPFRKMIKGAAHKILSGPLRRLIDYDKYYRKYEEACQTYNEMPTEKIGKFFCIPFHRGQIWYREDFEKTIKMSFEMLEIPVPVGYERILNTFFGSNWRVPIKAATAHSGIIADTNLPYKEYINKYL